MNPAAPAEVIETQLTHDGPIGILTINNTARRNALSLPIRRGLVRHLQALQRDAACRAIVITGAGGFFSAGGDVKSMSDRGVRDTTSEGVLDRRRGLSDSWEMTRMLLTGPKPVVTAVEGIAYGAGLSLAMSCDYTVSANNARFCAAQVLRGLAPDGGLYYTMAMRAGPGRARDLLLSGRVFSAVEAEKYCVAHELVEPGKALERALEYARQFIAISPLSLAVTRAAVSESYHTLEACYRAERDSQPILSASAEHREAVKAFLERRDPVFN